MPHNAREYALLMASKKGDVTSGINKPLTEKSNGITGIAQNIEEGVGIGGDDQCRSEGCIRTWQPFIATMGEREVNLSRRVLIDVPHDDGDHINRGRSATRNELRRCVKVKSRLFNWKSCQPCYGCAGKRCQ